MGTTPSYNIDLVRRETNHAFTPPKIIETVIEHDLSAEEEKIYKSIRLVISAVNQKLSIARTAGNNELVRRYSGYLLAMITYLRQCLFCSLIPIAKLSLDLADRVDRTSLSKLVMKEFTKLNLDVWMENIESAKSSRMKACLDAIAKHPEERVLVFTTFRTSVDLIQSFINERPHFTISSNMSVKKRNATIEAFAAIPNGIMVLTYDLGTFLPIRD